MKKNTQNTKPITVTISEINWWFLQKEYGDKNKSMLVDQFLTSIRLSKDYENTDEAKLIKEIKEAEEKMTSLQKELARKSFLLNEIKLAQKEDDKAHKQKVQQLYDNVKANMRFLND